jgi:tetratricopeptide (TPR) repeat protein
MRERISPEELAREIIRQTFTGRNEQISDFVKSLEFFTKERLEQAKPPKTMFAIFGEGGMGKTTLLDEFTLICGKRGVCCKRIDGRRWEPITNLVDLMRILRLRFPQTRRQRLLGQNPFQKFDAARKQYSGLEEKRKKAEMKGNGAALADWAAKTGAKMAIDLGRDVLPYASIATRVIGRERLEEGVEAAFKVTARFMRERLLQVLGNAEDVEFYENHEDILMEGISEGLANYLGNAPLVLLLDSYEELMDLDIELRERLLQKLDVNIIIVFSGRNNIYDNCNPLWRRLTAFTELKPFTPEETQEYFTKEGITNPALVSAIHDFTLGVPLAVSTAAEVVRRIGDERRALKIFKEDIQDEAAKEDRRIVVNATTSRFLNLVASEEEKAIVQACAVLGRFDPEMLQNTLGKAIKPVAFRDLERLSFIRRHGSKWVIHENVRPFVLSTLLDQEPKLLRQLHHRAAKHFAAELDKLGTLDDPFANDDWRAYTLERMYHLLRADPEEGLKAFYEALAEALWNIEPEFALELLGLAERPLSVEIEPAAQLRAGCAAYSAKNYSEAEKVFVELLACKVVDRRYWQLVHDMLGDIYGRLRQYQESREHYQRALSYFREFQESRKIAITLSNIAHRYQEEARWREAVDLLQQSLEIWQGLGKLEEARGLALLATAYKDGGDFVKAADLLQKGLALYRELDDKEGIAALLRVLGLTYRDWEKYAESVEYLRQGRELYQALGRSNDVADLWNYLGITYREWGRYPKAVKHYEEALARYEALDDQAMVANVLLGFGVTYRAWGKYAESVDYLEQSRELYETLDRPSDVAVLWNSLGITYREWGRYPEAVKHYEEAMACYQALDDQAMVANVLLGFGVTYQAWGKYAESVDYLERSKAMYQQLDRKQQMAGAMNALGITFRENGQYGESEQWHLQALQLSEGLEYRRIEADTHAELAQTYRQIQKHAEATEHFDQAIDLYTQINDQVGWADAVVELGKLYAAQRNVSEAERCFSDSLEVYRELNRPVAIAKTLREMGKMHGEARVVEEAEKELQGSLQLFIDLDIEQEIAETQTLLASLIRASSQCTSA